MSKSTNGVPSTPRSAVKNSTLEKQREKLKQLSTPPVLDPFEGTIFKGGSFKKQLETFKIEPRRALFGEFWRERELAVLVGQTGVGKSALAAQIALKIAEGASLSSLSKDGSEVDTPPQPVLFLDCENSIETWKSRLDEKTVPSNLFRFSIDMGSEFEGSFAREVVRSARLLLERTGSKVLIIDNVSWLFSDLPGSDIHVETSVLMKLLWQLKDETGTAILVVAHTLKGKGAQPFELGDVQGSSNLIKYLESLFAVAKVQGADSQRYLKQLKCRNRRERFTESSVAVFDLLMTGGALQYIRREELDSKEKLLLGGELEKREEIEQLLLEGEKTVREIADELEVSRAYVYKVKKESGTSELVDS